MSDQSDKPTPSLPEIIPPTHTEAGKFAAHNNANPSGYNGNMKGWQPIGRRYIVLGDKFTELEIIEMANNPELRAQKVSYWDGFAVMRMARAIDKKLTETDSGSDQCLKEANGILDRIEGTPVQTVRTSTLPPIKAEDIDNMSDADVAAALERLNQA